MKKIVTVTFLILFSLVYQVKAQFNQPCIKIPKMDFDLFYAGRTEIVDVIRKNGYLIVQTKTKSKAYNFSIDLKESEKEASLFVKGGRVTFIMEEDKKVVIIGVSSLNGQRVDVKKYYVCNNIILKYP